MRDEKEGRKEGRKKEATMYVWWVVCLAGIDGGLENESLIVWYRVSAFPWFRKLYAHPRGEQDLPPGDYSMLITYSILPGS